jgi:aspartyl-tRNA(Asn)/glutamyl-tRNA(Gln) amidotransferase subunit C
MSDAELSVGDVQKLARLARLELAEGEAASLRADLSRIVGYVRQLEELDTEGIEPLTHAVPMDQRRRKDEAAEHLVGRRGVCGSAGYDGGLVRLPRIVE